MIFFVFLKNVKNKIKLIENKVIKQIKGTTKFGMSQSIFYQLFSNSSSRPTAFNSEIKIILFLEIVKKIKIRSFKVKLGQIFSLYLLTSGLNYLRAFQRTSAAKTSSNKFSVLEAGNLIWVNNPGRSYGTIQYTCYEYLIQANKVGTTFLSNYDYPNKFCS